MRHLGNLIYRIFYIYVVVLGIIFKMLVWAFENKEEKKIVYERLKDSALYSGSRPTAVVREIIIEDLGEL